MGEESTRLSILTRLSNLSVKYDKRRKRRTSSKAWLEVKKDLETACGRLSREEAAEDAARLMEREAAARRHGLSDIPPPSEMTLVKRRKSGL